VPLRIKLCVFKILSSNFLRLLYSCSVGLNGNEIVNFMAFVGCIMD